MSRIQGRLERRDLGPGAWILVGERKWVLKGEIPTALLGKTVEVEGESEDSFGFEMAGPVFRARTVRAL